MKKPTELTKEAKLNLIYRHTHRDYKGSGKGDARAILVFRNGTSLVPLTDLTEAEIAEKLPYALHKESKAKEAKKAAYYLAHSPYTGESRRFPITEPLPIGWKKGSLPK